MTRDQIEAILKTAGAKAEKDGQCFPEGSNVTFHVAHDGASLSFPKIENIRFDGDLVYARSTKQSLALPFASVFAVAIEGASGQAVRRPAGF